MSPTWVKSLQDLNHPLLPSWAFSTSGTGPEVQKQKLGLELVPVQDAFVRWSWERQNYLPQKERDVDSGLSHEQAHTQQGNGLRAGQGLTDPHLAPTEAPSWGTGSEEKQENSCRHPRPMFPVAGCRVLAANAFSGCKLGKISNRPADNALTWRKGRTLLKDAGEGFQKALDTEV